MQYIRVLSNCSFSLVGSPMPILWKKNHGLVFLSSELLSQAIIIMITDISLSYML